MAAQLTLIRPWVAPTIFTFLVIAATWAFWPTLPTTLSKAAIAILTIVVAINIFKKSSHDLLRTFLVAYSVILASVLFERGYISEDQIIIIYGLLVFLIGLMINALRSEEKEGPLIEWLIACLISTQLFGLFLFWPISYLNRTLLVVVTFYMIWRFIQHKNAKISQIVIHFVFTGVIAMVVLGGIIWANFPHLLPS